MGTVVSPEGANGEVPSPLRSFVYSWKSVERFDGGVEELVGLGIEDQADAVDCLSGGEIRQVVAAVADLREGLFGRAADLKLEDKDASKSVGYKVGTPLRLSVLGANKKPQSTIFLPWC